MSHRMKSRGDASHLPMALAMYVATALYLLISGCTPDVAVEHSRQIITQPLPAAVRTIRVRIPYEHKTTYPFTVVDRYTSMDEACAGEVARLIRQHERRQPILRWCQKRAWFATRNRTVVSKVDGSQIHDVDRWAGHRAYHKALRAGWIDPETCAHHRVEDEEHPRMCHRIASRFRDRDKAKSWLRSSHAFGEWGSRGPTDTMAAWAYRYVPGCYPPSEMDRFDVAAEILIRRADRLCDDMAEMKLRCTVDNLKEVW